MTGQRLLHYAVLEQVGEGGMGVVYKARDTHLDRFVAIKLLPPEKVADPARKARFVQEAKAASALNHPNIITIYDIATDAGHDFIAMEYVSGKTLDQLIPRKGMRLNEALKLAVQIADALARAHAAGIIHRDLKPANIMVDEHGQVKVLDFGLAKLTETATASDAETLTAALDTAEGTVVGTAAYMSPELAEGKPVDARSDIFSFGAVLYEMLTGQRAFAGDTRMSTITAVLYKDPPPLPAEIPHDLARVITRCLRKDPARRFQHVDDLRVALDELKEESASGSLAPAAAKAGPRRIRRLLAVTTVLAGLGGTAWLIRSSWNRTHPAPRLSSATYFAGRERQPAFSPDGKQLVFVWDGEDQNNDDIYVMLVGSTAPLRLTRDPAPESAPAWSPDGTQIAFARGSGDHALIFLISALGGPERKVAEFRPVLQPPTAMESALSWSPDGEWLAFSEADPHGGNGISLLAVSRGERRSLASSPLDAFRYHYPAFSHDGRSLAFAACTGERSCNVYVQDLGPGNVARGQPRRLTNQSATIRGIAWAPDGNSLVYAASPDLSIPFRLWRVALSGNSDPELLLWAGEAVSHPAVSKASRRLSFSRALPAQGGVWKLAAAAAPVLFFPSGHEGDPRFSPDGQKIAFSANRAGIGSELWVANANGTDQVRLVESAGRMLGAVKWSPDGRWLVYNAQQADGRWDNYRIDAAGGQPQNLTAHPADDTLPGYARDGRWIYFASNRSGRFEVWRMPSIGGGAQQVTDRGGFEALESWDGATLYYTKSWGSALYARSVAGGPEREILPAARLAVLSFDVVKAGLYYVYRPQNPRTAPFEIRFIEPASGASQTVAAFEASSNQGLTVSPDQKIVLCGYQQRRNSDLILVENFR